jgi:hypothetical protein
MEPGEFEKHLEEMHRHEGIFWDIGTEEDEIRNGLRAIQKSLEAVTAPCFQEPMKLYSIFTMPWTKTTANNASQRTPESGRR